MATTGAVGQAWRADVTSSGSIEPWDGTAPIHWYVAADDRWHDPETDTGVRHRRVDGTAVFETRLHVPGGDVVQRIWSVADGGGYTLIEVANESSLPIVCAFTRPDVVAHRPIGDVPVRGIDLPQGSVLLPVGHRSRIVVGLAHGRHRPTLPTQLPSPDAVVRGWVARADAASRLDLPGASMVEAVRAARCEALLCGPPAPDADPERFLLTVLELVRMGEWDQRAARGVVEEVAWAVDRTVRAASPLGPSALEAAAVVLAGVGEHRASRDMQRLLSADATRAPALVDHSPQIEVVAAVERPIATGPTLFPHGIAPEWIGSAFEAHGLLAGPSSRVSVAVRWHGRNAAVLWEVSGEPVTLTSPSVPGWVATATRGEALWVLESPSLRL